MAGLSHLRRMLVLEAEALILLDLEQTLTEAGVQTVLVAATTDDALAIVDAALDAAILDLNLGRGGWSYDVARRLQQKGVPFVFSSGTNDVVEGFEGIPMVLKPFSSDQMINTLREASSGRDVVAA